MTAQAQLQTEIANNIFGLSRYHRLDLMEICTPAQSGLGQAVESLGGSVKRIGLHNGYDLATRKGLNRIAHELVTSRPRRVVLTPPCGPWSRIQAINVRGPESAAMLAHKRKV